MLRNSCLIDGNMITPSESFADSSNLCSLCERCIAENKTNRNWDCEDKNSTPFIKVNIYVARSIMLIVFINMQAVK